jgi:nitrite reductase (NO-forming)
LADCRGAVPLYPLVTHAFNFVGRGAAGIFMAGDGDPKN